MSITVFFFSYSQMKGEGKGRKVLSRPTLTLTMIVWFLLLYQIFAVAKKTSWSALDCLGHLQSCIASTWEGLNFPGELLT